MRVLNLFVCLHPLLFLLRSFALSGLLGSLQPASGRIHIVMLGGLRLFIRLHGYLQKIHSGAT